MHMYSYTNVSVYIRIHTYVWLYDFEVRIIRTYYIAKAVQYYG